LTNQPRPNFFIVGAAKCGTTSMYEYLRRHPDIYMPDFKEPLFFGRDLGIAPHWCVHDPAEYQALFAPAASKKRIGEASVWYLASQSAPHEIKQYSPDAKIIIMLRHPVDFLYSMQGLFLWTDNEDIADFEQALAAEPDRAAGRRIPKMAYFPKGLQYRKMAAFADQVQRYFNTFGRQNVHVILHDDLKSDIARVYRNVLEFLEIDPTYRPEFTRFNETRPIQYMPFHRFFNRPKTRGAIQKNAQKFSKKLRAKFADLLIWLCRPPYRSPKLDPTVRTRLATLFDNEVRALGELLGRDLSNWIDRPASPTPVDPNGPTSIRDSTSWPTHATRP
jgi:hypothetical protein